MKKKKIHTERRIYLNEDSEILDESSVVYSKIDTSDEVFYWVYDWRFVENLNKNELRVLMFFCQRVEFNTNVLCLSEYFLKEFSKNLLVDVGWLKRIVKGLEKHRMLYVLDKVTYRLSPLYFWRGTSKSRVRVLKLMIEKGEI